jgi:hypothetical protein
MNTSQGKNTSLLPGIDITESILDIPPLITSNMTVNVAHIKLCQTSLSKS